MYLRESKKPPKPKTSRKENLKCDHCDDIGYRNQLSGMVLCAKHAFQYKRHGKILENTRFEDNDYIVSECENYARINLRDRKSNKVGETIVDIEDLEIALSNRLHMKVSHKNEENPLYYAVAKINDKNVRLHTLIMGDVNIDHVDNDGLNNVRSNLRIVTNSENGMNQRLQARSISGVTGVNWSKRSKTWFANIKKNGIQTSRKENTFDNAVKTRLQGEANLFKEYAQNYNHDTNTIQLTYLSHDDNKQTFAEVNMDGDIINFTKLQ